MAYRMTGARQRALRKAQLISAQKRKRRFGFTQPGKPKMSKKHKKVLAVVAGGALVAGGAYGTSAWLNVEQRKAKVKAIKAHREQARRNVNRRRLERSPDMSTRHTAYHDAFTNEIIHAHDDGKNATIPSRVVRATSGLKVHTRLQSGLAAEIMRELDGAQIPGRPKGAKYKVINHG